MDGKRYLITPGPTPVPPEVVAAEAAPLHHHRSPDFRALLGETIAALKRLFATEHDVLLFTGSGTAAMESAVANLLSPGDRVVVGSAGNFGERWLKLVQAYGIEPVHVEHEWGERLDPARSGGRRRGRDGRGLRHPVRDLDRRRARHRAHRPRGGCRPAPCWWSTPSRASAGSTCDRRLGRRRGRGRLAEGADDAAGARLRVGLAARLGSGRARDPAALLPRLGRTADSQAKNDTAFTPAVTLVFGAARGARADRGARAGGTGPTTGGSRSRRARA